MLRQEAGGRAAGADGGRCAGDGLRAGDLGGAGDAREVSALACRLPTVACRLWLVASAAWCSLLAACCFLRPPSWLHSTSLYPVHQLTYSPSQPPTRDAAASAAGVDLARMPGWRPAVVEGEEQGEESWRPTALQRFPEVRPQLWLSERCFWRRLWQHTLRRNSTRG